MLTPTHLLPKCDILRPLYYHFMLEWSTIQRRVLYEVGAGYKSPLINEVSSFSTEARDEGLLNILLLVRSSHLLQIPLSFRFSPYSAENFSSMLFYLFTYTAC